MALIGINIDRQNPPFTKEDFVFWQPDFANLENLDQLFNKLYPIANKKIFYSIYGTDWEMAMSLCIAHYATLLAQKMQNPAGSSLASIASNGITTGVMTSATIGGFSKSWDLGASIIEEDSAKWWNQTEPGKALMLLLKTKAVPSIFVVTSYPVPGAN